MAAVALIVLGITASPARSADALIAVATNFAEPMEVLEADFERRSSHTIAIAPGSTGKLYGQIIQGAPFDVLLAADRDRPERLEAEGYAVSGSRFTYAIGRLTLWSADPTLIPADGLTVLQSGAFRSLAIANPDLAPYGSAALETLAMHGLVDALSDKLVRGQNAGQAFALIATGNAALGLVALSSVLSARNTIKGSRWDVPATDHMPIAQDAVLLARAADNPAARDFMDYLRSTHAREIIGRFGYGFGP